MVRKWKRNEAIMFSHEMLALWRLRQAGFGKLEILRLWRLRCTYSAKQDQLESQAQYRRLQFVRYLVTTGRLTEQMVQVPETKRQ
jgi:hypothetical protein